MKQFLSTILVVLTCAEAVAFADTPIPAAVSANVIESRSYLYAGSTTIYTHNVDRTGGNLNLVCPDYFEISDTGALKLTRPVDDVFIQNMHDRNVEVLPFVSNHWNRALGRLALANRDVLITQLVAQVAEHNLDGLDIDIENINHEDRASFTAFITKLRAQLPASKKLSVCVAANPWGGTTGWQGAYDYQALGRLVDALFIMTYDESYEGSQPGPVASYKFITDSVAYAKRFVPEKKIMLGIPFYGRYWLEGAASGGKAFTLSDIERITDQYSSVTWYNADHDCARAQVTVSVADLEAGLWGNKKLTTGVYDIWYEDETSIAKKLGLIRHENIRGAGSWALGYEPDTLWPDYRLWMQGLPYLDIENTWAQPFIVTLHEKGLITGYNNLYKPKDTMTRAELTVLLCRMLGLAPETTPSGFTDTVGHWADGYLAAMRKHNIISGATATTFAPNLPISRQEAAVLFEKVLHVPETMDFSEPRYPDVSPETNPWSNNAIALLSMYGVITGDGNGYFRPTDHCTRADAAKFAVMVSELPLKLPKSPEPAIEPR